MVGLDYQLQLISSEFLSIKRYQYYIEYLSTRVYHFDFWCMIEFCSLDERVLIVTCKQLVWSWSIRIVRNMSIWVLTCMSGDRTLTNLNIKEDWVSMCVYFQGSKRKDKSWINVTSLTRGRILFSKMLSSTAPSSLRLILLLFIINR